MVMRYKFNDVVSPGMYPERDGNYVKYEDYAELDDSFQDYIVTTEMEVAELVARLAEVNAELQKYEDQFPDYIECANCGSVTHVEGVE